jgi:uncharacterized protein YneF (UPF0154 family)
MIWILLLYVLPFIVSSAIGYYVAKKDGSSTIGEYLVGVLLMLIPILNIVVIGMFINELAPKLKIIQDIKEYLKQPL